MAELKTKLTEKSVQAFLESIEDEKQRQDAFALLRLMQEVIGAEAEMWGESIVGFGRYRYKSASGRSGEWFMSGFSPRKQSLSLYIMGIDTQGSLISSLGKYKTGKSCLYVKKLEDVDIPTLRALVKQSIDFATKMNAD